MAAALREHHAGDVYCDHFWPSLEVYYGEKVHFVGAPPEEISEKADDPTEHFETVQGTPPPGSWFLHFRKEQDPEFQQWLNDPGIPKIVIGDFVIGPLKPRPVATAPSA